MRGKQPILSEPTEEVTTDQDDVLIMSLRLKSNRFESTIQIPLFASDEDKAAFVDAWLHLMTMGLKCSPRKK